MTNKSLEENKTPSFHKQSVGSNVAFVISDIINVILYILSLIFIDFPLTAITLHLYNTFRSHIDKYAYWKVREQNMHCIMKYKIWNMDNHLCILWLSMKRSIIYFRSDIQTESCGTYMLHTRTLLFCTHFCFQ